MQSAEVGISMGQSGSGAGNGTGSLSFTIPSMPPLVGAASYAQWALLDTGSPNGTLSMSGVLEIVFG